MLTKSYQFALFSPQGKLVLNTRIRGWALLVLPTLLFMLLAGNYFLHNYYELHENKQREMLGLSHEIQRLNSELLDTTASLLHIENTLARVTDFNAKLRVMLNMDGEADRQGTLLPTPRRQRGLRRLPALFGHNMARHLRNKLTSLEEAVLQEEVQQQAIAHSIAQQLEKLATIPVIMPTRGRFSSPFGWRKDPFKGTRRFHKGIDITARTGTPVRATANGFVAQVTRSPSYGLVIVLNHSEELRTRYAHLSGFAVKYGQRVLRGQVIGYVGNTGRSKAPHLHYEVHFKDKPVNPRNYILQ